MRITSINIPIEQAGFDGLEEIKMNKLGQVVIVAGKNGSGKTRLLNRIVESFRTKPRKNEVAERSSKLYKLEKRINKNESHIQSLVEKKEKLNSVKQSAEIDKIEIEISAFEDQNNFIKNDIFSNLHVINWDKIVTNELANEYNPILFVPKSLTLTDSGTLNQKAITRCAIEYLMYILKYI